MNDSKPTKLGAVADTTVSKRSNAMLSGVFRSSASMRSYGNLSQVTNRPPREQLQLSSEQKEEVFSRDLNVADPQAPQTLVRLKFSQNVYEDIPTGDSIIINADRIGRIGLVNPIKVQQKAQQSLIQGGEGGAVAGGEEEEEEEMNNEMKDGKLLRNQFNFSDRATQGQIIAHIDQGTLSEAPSPKDCKGSTNQREIAAAYSRDKNTTLLPPPMSALQVTRIMERVVNQNLDPNACLDFKYFDDARDSLSRLEGYTLPLWEFKPDAIGTGYGVTSMRWCPTILDLFAATYSPTSDKMQPQRGFLLTWSLKNHSTPRNILELTAPALSVDWNPYQVGVIAAGSSDGNIAIYDIRKRMTSPIFSTLKSAERHSAGVSVVRWQPVDSSLNHNLISAGLDGRILQWTMIQNEMKVTDIAQLPAGIIALDYYNEKSTHFTVACDDGFVYRVLRTRTTQPPTAIRAHSPPVLALSFNRFHPEVFATAGSDWSAKIWRESYEGVFCEFPESNSKARESFNKTRENNNKKTGEINNKTIENINGEKNRNNESRGDINKNKGKIRDGLNEIYSGSNGADNCAAIGEMRHLQRYDYAPFYVNDLQFAPYSSTILATVNSDGSLFLYDIAVKRYQHICKTEVVEANDGALTAVRFHQKWPIIIVGDDKGRVHSFKLSPNIRRNTKIDKEEDLRNKLTKSASSRDSRGLLPDLTQQPDDDDEANANAAAEEEARLEALSHDESAKFEKSMGVSWIERPVKESALPSV